MGGLLVVGGPGAGGDRGLEGSAGAGRGREVLDPQQAGDVAVRVGAEHRVEAVGGDPDEGPLQRVGDPRCRGSRAGDTGAA